MYAFTCYIGLLQELFSHPLMGVAVLADASSLPKVETQKMQRINEQEREIDIWLKQLL